VYKAKPSTIPDMAIENAHLWYRFDKQMWKGVNEARKEQPTGVAWNYPFKARLRDGWVQHLREQLRSHTAGAKFELRAPDRVLVARWIRSAWNSLSAATIANGYKKAYGCRSTKLTLPRPISSTRSPSIVLSMRRWAKWSQRTTSKRLRKPSVKTK